MLLLELLLKPFFIPLWCCSCSEVSWKSHAQGKSRSWWALGAFRLPYLSLDAVIEARGGQRHLRRPSPLIGVETRLTVRKEAAVRGMPLHLGQQ